MTIEKIVLAKEPNVIKTKGNILIIEDHQDTAETLVLFFANQGFGVRRAETRDEALRVLDAYIYDVIVMDNFMVGMTAEIFVKEALRRRPSTKFILITATDCVAKEAAKLGIARWIGKPFDPENLLSLVLQL
jgi:DNA-binding NtrC family response regulator